MSTKFNVEPKFGYFKIENKLKINN